MIKKLHLYLLKEFFGSFVLGVIVFSVLLILNLVFDIADFIISRGIGFLSVLQMFALSIPKFLTLAIPMSVVFGILLSYGKISADNEFTAMKSSGVSYTTLTMPIIIFVCIISCFLMFFNHFLAPAINSRYMTIFEEIMMQKPLVKFNEKSTINLGSYSLYADRVNNEGNVLYGVSAYVFTGKDNNIFNKGTALNVKRGAKSISPQNNQEKCRITAPLATLKVYSDGVQFTFYKGCLQNVDPSNMNEMTHVTFKTFVVFIPLADVIKKYALNPDSMQSHELLKIIKEYKKQKVSTIEYERELWIRWIFAFAPLALSLITLPIGIMIGKNGKAIGFVISLIIILIYYALFMLTLNLGEKEYIPLKIIVWTPNVVITALGIYLLRRMVKK
ncbi:MAG: LptF/LptG family permease [Endomicrobium sp.]|jgi:lipopolysaccharide export system permease protein|nr:LptF/LptG family permease [Endomicrobium sp.]